MNLDECELWRRFKDEGDCAAREALILQYLPFAKWIARRVTCGWADESDKDGAFSDAVLGLIEAVDRYKVNQNVKFMSFAAIRIRGAIIDQLRRGTAWSWFTRWCGRRDHFVALDALVVGRDGPLPFGETLADDRIPPPYAGLLESEAIEACEEALAVLSPQRRQLVEGALRGAVQTEVAAAMGVSGSWVSYLTKRAHREMRDILPADLTSVADFYAETA